MNLLRIIKSPKISFCWGRNASTIFITFKYFVRIFYQSPNRKTFDMHFFARVGFELKMTFLNLTCFWKQRHKIDSAFLYHLNPTRDLQTVWFKESYDGHTISCFIDLPQLRTWHLLLWRIGISQVMCYALFYQTLFHDDISTRPASKVHGTNVGPIWGRQDPGGPHVCPMNFAIWACMMRIA